MLEGERFNIRRIYHSPEVELAFTAPSQIIWALGDPETKSSAALSSALGNSPAQQTSAAMSFRIATQLFANDAHE